MANNRDAEQTGMSWRGDDIQFNIRPPISLNVYLMSNFENNHPVALPANHVSSIYLIKGLRIRTPSQVPWWIRGSRRLKYLLSFFFLSLRYFIFDHVYLLRFKSVTFRLLRCSCSMLRFSRKIYSQPPTVFST